MAKFYYNNVLLPEIPSDVLTSYPYAVIMKNTDSGNYDLCLGSDIWWYLSGKLYHDNIPYITSYRYTVPIATSEDATEWEYAYAGKVNGYSVDDTNSIVWSNHNILLDSSTSIRTYFYGSEPVPESGGEPTTDILYTVNGSSLTAVANAIRGKTGTTQPLTPLDMPSVISEIVTSSDLPKAEDTLFGKSDSEVSYGLIGYEIAQYPMATNHGYSCGYKFTAAEDFQITGMRYSNVNGVIPTLKIWDSDGNVLKEVVPDSAADNDWLDVPFGSPLNVYATVTYTFGWYHEYGRYQVAPTGYDSRLLDVQCVITSAEADECPTVNVTRNCYPAVDIIIANIEAEKPPNYEVTLDTMNSIASEVSRITGSSPRLTPANMITALKGM